MVNTKKTQFNKLTTIPGQFGGILHVTLTTNNTLLTLTDLTGQVWTWTTCSNCGFVGSQKSTAVATITTAEEMGFRIKDLELAKILVIFHGLRKFRKAVLRGLARAQVYVDTFVLKPTIPYNGCRLAKKRRK